MKQIIIEPELQNLIQIYVAQTLIIIIWMNYKQGEKSLIAQSTDSVNNVKQTDQDDDDISSVVDQKVNKNKQIDH
ncbi:unnamed protein product [Paramecium sonneborni]|uniref:Uncharacterized protein n=1 Tax=Paramecium sonneborni TaxID=65129 RepID=A0A8S1NBQ3_9CILI|nr:unnamed protein product [Paramecium sonneborni]